MHGNSYLEYRLVVQSLARSNAQFYQRRVDRSVWKPYQWYLWNRWIDCLVKIVD